MSLRESVAKKPLKTRLKIHFIPDQLWFEFAFMKREDTPRIEPGF